MRLILLLTGLSLVLGGASARLDAQAPGTTHPRAIFRDIQFAPYASITLGAPLPAGAPPSVARPDGSRVLTVPDLGGTDSIAVQLTSRGRVGALRFYYPARSDFDQQVAEYTTMLGAPETRRRFTNTMGATLELVGWRDASTTFILTRTQSSGRPDRIESVLTDTARTP